MRAPNLRYLWRTSRFRAQLRRVEDVGGAQNAAIFERARAELRIITRVPGELAAATAHYFEAWLCLLSGNRDGALKELKAARALDSKSPFYNLGIQYVLGRLEGGDGGRRHCEQAVAQIRSEGWRSVHRGLALRLPVTLELCDELIGLP